MAESQKIIKAKLSVDDWLMRAAMGVIGLYLLITLAFPLFTIFSKSVETYAFELAQVEIQVIKYGAAGAVVTAQSLAEELGWEEASDPRTGAIERLPLKNLFPDAKRDDVGVSYRIRDLSPEGGRFLIKGEQSSGNDWIDLDSQLFFRVLLKPAQYTGLDNYVLYVQTPALARSIWNSIWVSAITTVITVSLAFWFAYALTRSCMKGKGAFKAVATVPLLVPSLLPGISLVYLFGNQGLIKEWLMGESIYGPIGIVMASVFFTLPHALLILLVALRTADQRLYEAATALRASRWRTFWTVTIPGARYGLISAFFVVFTLTITDFGVPKVIGGQFNVLAVDIYKQVIGQQNFQMGSVVAVVLLIPAILAFTVDRWVQKRQVAQLSARAVPYQPKPSRLFDWLMFGYCSVIAIFILGLMAIAQAAAIFKLWPYDLSLSFKNFNFNKMDGGGWSSYWNSLELACWTAVVGTLVVFSGAYLVEKARGFRAGRGVFQFLAMLPMAIPGMVLGLAYIFFFNNPDNPFNFIYQTMAILVICTVAHFYTVAHLTAVTALKQLDNEFEAVSHSLKRSVFTMFRRVTVPVSLPAILDIAIYLFVNAMTTVSAVVFIYGPHTTLASVAVLNMDDAGDIAPAAAMGMMIFYSNLLIRALQSIFSWWIEKRTQAWRKR